MTYRVFVTASAEQRIREHAHWIANEQAGARVAAEWTARIAAAVESLASMPRRCPVAAENALCNYEVRRLAVGQFVLLFTVVDSAQEVWVVHARHGRQLTRRGDVPRAPGSRD